MFNSNSKSKDENKNNNENVENIDKLNLEMRRRLTFFYPAQLKIVQVKENYCFVDKNLKFYEKLLFWNSEK